VKAIINQDDIRDILETDELRCNIKDITLLFDNLKEDYEKKGYRVDQSNPKKLEIYFRSGLGRITVLVEDMEENNILNIESSYSQILVPKSLSNWMKKEFLGLRNSLWIILLVLTLVLVPFIVLSFISSVSLRISGFVLIGIGSTAIVLYFILNIIVTRERKTRKSQAILFIKGLKEKVSVYSLEKPSSKICWNCFYEINKNENRCPKCKADLEQ
jgi:hypothetical protein